MIWGILRKRESQTLGPALLGKLPCQPDFVREGFRGAATDALDAFLVQATPLLHQGVGVARLPLLWICQSLPRHAHALVGVCAPSRDAAGRPFPVAVVHAVDRERLQPALSEVFWLTQGFLGEAEGLVSRLGELNLADARGEFGALARADLLQSGQAPTDGRGQVAPPAAAFERVIDAGPEAQSYALYAVASAFAAKHPGLTLDCPARDASQARLWLTLAGRAAEATNTCMCVVYARQTGRLLISIDAWHPGELRAIADPSFSFDQLWPLTTERQDARVQAQAALAQAGSALSRPRGASLHELADQLARFSLGLRNT